MTLRPIIFDAESVRAILAGRKTQTRRVVKPQPKHRIVEGLAHVTVGMDPADDGRDWYDADGIGPGRLVRCPYGGPGDRLWVRETWCEVPWVNDDGTEVPRVVYRADNPAAFSDELGDRWRSPIHLPRSRSRLTLEIVRVRVDRVDHISEMDAHHEGVEPVVIGHGPIDPTMDEAGMVASASYREGFRMLWDRLNSKRGHPWASNPWVFAIEFRPLNHSPSTADAADGGAGAEENGAPSCPVRQAGHPNTPTAADAAGEPRHA